MSESSEWISSSVSLMPKDCVKILLDSDSPSIRNYCLRPTQTCIYLLYETRSTYFQTPPDVVDGHVTFAVFVDELETFDVKLDFFFAQIDGDLVSARPVHVLTHFVVQELRRQLRLFLLLI